MWRTDSELTLNLTDVLHVDAHVINYVECQNGLECTSHCEVQ